MGTEVSDVARSWVATGPDARQELAVLVVYP